MIRSGRPMTVIAACLAIAACHDLSAPTQIPPGQQDPSVYDTPVGAVQQAQGALRVFHDSYDGRYAMTDELIGASAMVYFTHGGSCLLCGSSTNGFQYAPDQRQDDASSTYNFSSLNRARLFSDLAHAALAKYAAETPASLRAEVLATQGYAELVLADEYCSGIPLSTIQFEGTFTYAAGSSTIDVYKHAASLFESALPLADGSDSITTLVRVGWGRALLSAGLFDSAAHVVASVPVGSAYRVRRVSAYALGQRGDLHFSVVDREGTNGLSYISSHDPRVPLVAMDWINNLDLNSAYKVGHGYQLASEGAGDSLDVPLASGIEARLIQSEAALQAAARTGSTGDVDAWLAQLNALRTNGNDDGTAPLYQIDSVQNSDGTYTVTSTFVRTDTLWQAGTGGVARLGPLGDPGAGLSASAASAARVDLMFKERAFWLFLQGQRQGDMRRLIRQYHRQTNRVYPVGQYPLAPGQSYGPQVTIPVNDAGNPLFRGCINRDA